MARVQHKYFNPRHFSITNENDNSSIDDSNLSGSDKIITKGENGKNVFNVDLSGIEQDVIELLKNPNVKISELTGILKDKYDRIRLTAQMLYDTDYYGCFFDRITKHCTNIKSPIPGSIGGYLCGCLASKNFVEYGCSPICADGLAYPKNNEEWKHCDKAVIWAKYQKQINGTKTEGYVFSVVKEGASLSEYDPTYLFIDTDDIHNFKGFSIGEKEYLIKLGVSKLKVYGSKSTESGVVYPRLYHDIINLNDIKMRNVPSTSLNTNNNLYIILLILVIILIVFFVWFFKFRHTY